MNSLKKMLILQDKIYLYKIMSIEHKSIGVFIDGGYFAKINEALQDNLSTNINISGLFSFIRSEIVRMHGLALDECFITEAHYFRGRYRAHDASNKHLLLLERKFEDILIENDVIFHISTYVRCRKMELRSL